MPGQSAWPVSITTALAWCASTADVAAAHAALDAGIAHIHKPTAAYHRAEMGSRERACRERLAQVQAARAAR